MSQWIRTVNGLINANDVLCVYAKCNGILACLRNDNQRYYLYKDVDESKLDTIFDQIEKKLPGKWIRLSSVHLLLKEEELSSIKLYGSLKIRFRDTEEPITIINYEKVTLPDILSEICQKLIKRKTE